MDSQIAPDTTSLGEHEFTVPCTTGKGECDLPARWMVWVAHSMRGCSNTANACDYHKALLDELWRRELNYAPRYCKFCGEAVSRAVGDNVKWLPL